MLSYDTSTRGTDLLAQFPAHLFNMNVGIVILVIDAIVVCLGGMLFSTETFVLSVITIVIVGITKVIAPLL